MKLINREELINRITAEYEDSALDCGCWENILDIIEDMPNFDCVKTKNGDLIGRWRD